LPTHLTADPWDTSAVPNALFRECPRIVGEMRMNRRKQILVVDDDERVLLVLRRALMRLSDGCEVVTAHDGREALDKAESVLFDLVITDLRMPGMDGVELTEAIRALNPRTAVLWVTAYSCYELAEEAARLSVYDCLDKPLKVSEIRRIARKALASGEVETDETQDGGSDGTAG
jgi:DNA-binding NtrC family response regulator